MKGFWIILAILVVVFRVLWKMGKGDAVKRKRKLPSLEELKQRARGITKRAADTVEKSGPPPIPTPDVSSPNPGGRPGRSMPAPDRAYRTSPKYWVDVIRVGEPSATRRAVDQLVALGPAAIPALEEAERDSMAHVREEAKRALARIRGALVLPGDPGVSRREETAPPAPPPLLPPPPPPPVPEPSPLPRADEQPAPESAPEPAPEPEPPEPEPPEPEPPEPEPPEPEVEAAPPEEPDYRWDREEEKAPEPEPTYRWDKAPEPEPTPEAAPATEGGLVEALQAVAKTPSFGGDRKEAIAALEGRVETFEVEVQRVQWTGVLGASESYRNGRTIGGRIAGTDVPVAALLPPAQNDLVDALKEGERRTFHGAFAGWDAIYDRGRFEGELEA